MIPGKVCNDCGHWLPAIMFPKCTVHKDGLGSYCRHHNGRRTAAWKKANPKRAKELEVENRQRHPERRRQQKQRWRLRKKQGVL